jgi:hypothetical protein
VGEQSIIRVPYTLVPEAQVQQFTQRWDGLLAR